MKMSILLISFLTECLFQIKKHFCNDYAGETKPNKAATRNELSVL